MIDLSKTITELTLILAYLTGWEEDSRKKPGEKIFKSWKGYKFETIDELSKLRYINDLVHQKSITLTPEGLGKVKELTVKYLGEEVTIP